MPSRDSEEVERFNLHKLTMQHERKFGAFWSDGLARTLLSSISDKQLASLVAVACRQQGLEPKSMHVPPSKWLRKHSAEDPRLQAAIMKAWRESNPDVVAAAELISMGGSAEQCEAMLHQFSTREVLLELLTDEHDDGWELAGDIINGIQDESARRDLRKMREALSKGDATHVDVADQAKVRVVIFGGHVRDESKMVERLFAGSSFDVRWRPFEKGTRNPTVRDIDSAMANADAVLVVTTMVSHTIMKVVKNLARDKEILFQAVPKATHLCLTAALNRWFPDLMCQVQEEMSSFGFH